MPFKPGQSGNPSGRPKGSGNKVNQKLKEMIDGFLMDSFDQIVVDFQSLKPQERVKMYSQLLQYSIGKQQNISEHVSIERLPDEQLDEIITRIHRVQVN